MKHRITNISDPQFLHKNLNILKNIFLQNQYPQKLLNKILFNIGNLINTNIDSSKMPVKYKKLTFVPGLTEKLIKIFHDNILDFSFKIIEHYPFKLASVFSNLKDKVPLKYQSNIIYRVPCGTCHCCYVGQTKQWLKNRMNQHRNEVKNNKNNGCALAQHSLETGHLFDFDNVTILDRENNYYNRLFLEMFHIKNEKYTVNFKTDTGSLSNIYSWIFDNYNKFEGKTSQRLIVDSE